MTAPALLERRALVPLFDSGAIKRAIVRSIGRRWVIAVVTADREFVVATQRTASKPRVEPRQFGSLDTAALYVHELGMREFTVDQKNWTPRQEQLAPVASKSAL